MTTTEEPSLAEVRRMLLSPKGLKRYQAYDVSDQRFPRTSREHLAIVNANFNGGATDGQDPCES